MADLFILPFRPAYDNNAKVIPGAQARFTLEGTNTAADVYVDEAMTTPHANPVVANGIGRWPPIYLDESVVYRVRIYDADADILTDTPVEEYDPYTSGTILGGSAFTSGTDALNVFDYMSDEERVDVSARTRTLNVTQALQAASAALQDAGGGTLYLPPGDYVVVEQTLGGTLLDGVTPAAWGPQEIITIKNCPYPVKITGYGAVLVAEDGYKYGAFDPVTGDPHPSVVPFSDYDYYGYPYRAMINVEGNAAVIIEGIELDGNSANAEIGGEFGDSNWQVEGHGIWNKDNDSFTARDVHAHHQPGDGIITAATGITESSEARPALFENVRCLYNGRQGHSFTGAKSATMINCDFSMTGQVMNTSLGDYLRTSPGCGIDVEAEGTLVRDLTFIGCRFLGNYRYGVIAASGFSKGVNFLNCTIENAVIGRFRYHFTNCLFIGFTNFALPATNEYHPVSTGMSLTIAGAGPYTLTRAAGDFTADGFEVGDTAVMPSVQAGVGAVNAGLNAANKNKRLSITALTATVMTVTVEEGGTLTPEGPIASSVIATPIIEGDAFHFDRCRFRYDDSLSGTGTMINSTQSDWDEALYSTWRDCYIDTGAQLLPSVYKSPLAKDSLIWENCIFKSAYVGATDHAITGYFRGVNRFTLADTIVQQFGTASQVDYGHTYVNGTEVGGAASSVFGYTSADFGTVTQAGAKSNGVTLDEYSGEITMHNQSLGADAATAFTLTNNKIAADDLLLLNHVSGGTAGAYMLNARCGAGAANIDVRNVTAGALGEAIVIGFAVVKANAT
jgi:hypothetical protein